MYNYKRKKKKIRILYKNRRIKSIRKPPHFFIKNLEPRAVIRFSINNMFFNIACRLKKEPFLYSTIYWTSCGSEKFSKPKYKGRTKTTYMANFALGTNLAKKILMFKIKRKITIAIKGSGNYIKAFINAFKISYMKRKIKIIDLTPISLNGCRFQKQRRT